MSLVSVQMGTHSLFFLPEHMTSQEYPVYELHFHFTQGFDLRQQMNMADQPLPSIEIHDLDEAFQIIQQLKAKNDYLSRRYAELHTEYRQQEQGHDYCKASDAQKQRQIQELEDEVRRLRSGQTEKTRMLACIRIKLEEKSKGENDIGWKVLPKWQEDSEMKGRSKRRRY